MMRATTTLSAALLALGVAQAQVSGTVFSDRNGNGIFDSNESGIAGVKVSNGRDVVITDRDGNYELEEIENTVFFASKPNGYDYRLDAYNRPEFFYVHYPEGTGKDLRYGGVDPTGPIPDELNFGFVPARSENEYDVILFGDTQPYNKQEVWFTAHDAVTEVIGTDARFGVSLGDVVGDDLRLLMPLVRMKGQIGVPWHYIHGNHDMDFDADSDAMSDDSWTRLMGAPYYSFDEGKATFYVLENVDMNPEGGYGSALNERQIEWLLNDLKNTPKNRLIVLTMHIPMTDLRNEERTALMEALSEFDNSVSFAAHWHVMQHFFFGEDLGYTKPGGHQHLVTGTVCGSWWDGELDELGIPHTMMRDGGPRGYLYLSVDGTDYNLRYKPTRRPADYQMNIWFPSEIQQDAIDETEVVVNAFFGSEKCKVEMSLDGENWIEMERRDAIDPYYARLKALEAEGPLPATGNPLPGARETPHIWFGGLPTDVDRGTHTIRVRFTDMLGNVHHDQRIVEVR
ncbi:MAG: calcineurin-like phosphoesterase C-terminal domain-containing protein [Fimbriimonadaceae bacterium]